MMVRLSALIVGFLHAFLFESLLSNSFLPLLYFLSKPDSLQQWMCLKSRFIIIKKNASSHRNWKMWLWDDKNYINEENNLPFGFACSVW